jgi:hypothetical protein
MKTKHILFSIALLFTSLLINAQSKNDYMTINYEAFKSKMCISINGETVINEKAERPEDDTHLNTNPILKKIKEYEDKGWELVSFTVPAQFNYITYSAFLRKKKN